ncbi:MAG: hypothetical protein ACETVR_00385 [Candidatus Bathyarchaeia archaeon]
MTVADVLIRGARQEVQHVIGFATTPTGPFSTVDQMVTTARQTVRNVGAEVGLRGPGMRGSRFRGQLGTRVEALRGRFPRLRRY